MDAKNKARPTLTAKSTDYIPLDLPVITKKDLQREPTKPPKPGEILPTGVHWREDRRRYEARSHHRKIYFLGYYYTAEEAKKAVEKFRKLHPIIKPDRQLTNFNWRPRVGCYCKYKGVSKYGSNRCCAGITNNRKSKILAIFPNTKEGKKQAALAYDKAAEKMGGKNVKHNQYWFPEDFKTSI